MFSLIENRGREGPQSLVRYQNINKSVNKPQKAVETHVVSENKNLFLGVNPILNQNKTVKVGRQL